LGVNQIGRESANDLMTEGRDLPWLQEDATYLVWDDWEPVYRDVIVLDGDNIIFGVYNLSSQDLGDDENYNALRQLFVDAANSL